MIYRDIIETFNYEILYWRDFGVDQGDSFILFKNQNRYGYLVIGWGSCIGCDMLKGCVSDKDYLDLAEKLYNQIRWGTASGTIKWIAEDSNDWYLYMDEFEGIFKEVTAIIINDYKNE